MRKQEKDNRTMPKKTNKREPKRLQIKGVKGVTPNLGFPSSTTKAELETFKQHAKRIVQCIENQMPMYDSDEAWLRRQSSMNKRRLNKLGIPTNTQNDEAVTYNLPRLVERTLAKRLKKRIGEKARGKWELNAERLVRFCNKESENQRQIANDVRNFTTDDAIDYYNWLIDKENLAEGSTSNRAASYARHFFKAAIKEKLIEDDPFDCDEIEFVVQSNEENHYYISEDERQAIWGRGLKDDEDRLRFLLMIRMGVRSPSEQNELKWADINWKNGMVTIRSPKLKRYPKWYRRECPITFPDLEKLLKERYGRAKDKKGNILKTISHTTMTKIVKRWLGAAGLDLWPDLLQNFRRTAVTDACEIWPSHVVSSYFGHSEFISNKHYRMRHSGYADRAKNLKPFKSDEEGEAA